MNIGIDIGGSHTTMGLIDDDGNFKARDELRYNPDESDVMNIFEVINAFIDEYSDVADSIGIGVPGIATEHLINYTCNMPLTNTDVLNYIDTDLPIYISNDANCAAIAEYELIDKKMFNNYILVTIGTGIGAGIILNSSLYTGSTGTAGEIGHMVIEQDGIPCKCGRKGCFEKYASASALLKTFDTDNLEEVFYLVDREPRLQNAFNEYLEKVSEGLANVINMYDPEMLVIGGKIAEYEDKFLPLLKNKIAQKIYNKYTYDLNLKTAKLKNDAGVIGASMLYKYL